MLVAKTFVVLEATSPEREVVEMTPLIFETRSPPLVVKLLLVIILEVPTEPPTLLVRVFPIADKLLLVLRFVIVALLEIKFERLDVPVALRLPVFVVPKLAILENRFWKLPVTAVTKLDTRFCRDRFVPVALVKFKLVIVAFPIFALAIGPVGKVTEALDRSSAPVNTDGPENVVVPVFVTEPLFCTAPLFIVKPLLVVVALFIKTPVIVVVPPFMFVLPPSVVLVAVSGPLIFVVERLVVPVALRLPVVVVPKLAMLANRLVNNPVTAWTKLLNILLLVILFAVKLSAVVVPFSFILFNSEILVVADSPFTILVNILVVVAKFILFVVDDNTALIEVVAITPLTLEIRTDPDEVNVLVVAEATSAFIFPMTALVIVALLATRLLVVMVPVAFISPVVVATTNIFVVVPLMPFIPFVPAAPETGTY